MKNACNLLIELYATKLTKRDLLDAYLIWMKTKSEPEFRLGASASERCKHGTMSDARKAAKRFIEPVFEQLYNKTRNFHSSYQYELYDLLRSAIDNNIMNNDGQILDRKQFVNEILGKCVLPNNLRYMTDTHLPVQLLFYSLTGLDFAHIILEQINHVDIPDYATQYKEQVKQNGIASNFYTLVWALSDCREPELFYGYRPIVTDDDIRNAVGTDPDNVLNLCKTIVSRMSANVKK